jgi:translocator protein
MNKNVVRQVIVVLAVAATLVVNWLANALPLNGQTTGEISDRFNVYFVPAGYVFAIWDLIYIGLVAFAIYQALPAQRVNPRLQSTGYLVALSCVANTSWLFLWHYEQFVWKPAAMLTLLILLITIYARLGIGRVVVPSMERWTTQGTFSIYLGWISVATIADVTTTLHHLGWGGWGISEQVWAVVMLAVATALGWAMMVQRRDVIYLLVLIWAFVGIAVKQSDTATVAVDALVAAGLVAVALVRGLLANRRGGQRLPPAPAASGLR